MVSTRARSRSTAATRRPWGRRREDAGSELIIPSGERRGPLIAAGCDVILCDVGVARRRRRSRNDAPVRARGRHRNVCGRLVSLSTLQVHGFATPRAFRRWGGHLRRRRGVNNFSKTPSGTLRGLRDPKPEPAPRPFVPRGARVPASKLDRKAPTRSSDYEVGAPSERRLHAFEHQIRERVKNVVVAGNS